MTSQPKTALPEERDSAWRRPAEFTQDDSDKQAHAYAGHRLQQVERNADEVLLDLPCASDEAISEAEPILALGSPPSDGALKPDFAAEATLIERAKCGDVDAFATLYDAYGAAVSRFLYRRVGNREDAEDLTQQVFLQAWAALHRFEQRERPLRAWLFTIAHHVFVTHYRKTATARRRDQREMDQQRSLAEGTTRGSPDLLAEDRWELERVGRAIRTLPPVHQQVIILHFLRGLKHKAIAGLVGKSHAAVRIIHYRALRRLRTVLGPLED